MNLRQKVYHLLAVVFISLTVVQSVAPIMPVQAAQTILKPTVTITQKTLYVGYQNYTIKFKNLSKYATVAYKSSRNTIATVSSKGLIKPMKAGTATITTTVKQGGVTYSSQIKVTVKNPYVSITNLVKEIKVGTTYTFNSKAYGINSESLIWTSSNSRVATIGGTTGIFYAKSKGNTTITLKDTATGTKKEILVKVIPAVTYVPPEGSDSAAYLSGLDLSKETGKYYTTTKEEYIETTRFVLYLTDGVDVPVNVIELINYMMDTIESETGYKFYVEHLDEYGYFGMGYELDQYFDTAEELKKINANHEKVEITVANHDLVVDAYANGGIGILLKPQHINLLDGGADAIIHELLHVVSARNGRYMGMALSEGFATYYTDCIIEKDTMLHCTFDSFNQFKNYQNIITEATMEDLFIHYIAGQSSYQLGFRLVHFIIEKYGDDAYRRVQAKVTELFDYTTEPPMETIAAIIKSELSEDFFEAFARWHIVNREKFGDKDMTVMGDWLIESGYLRKYYGNDTHVVIPNTVLNIQPEAFMACETLEIVEIPNTVSVIAGGAFFDCINLKEISIPDSVTTIIFNAFQGCSSLKKVVLPKELKNIAISAFMDCTSLTEIKLPEGITAIESNAFDNCSALTNINLPNRLEIIGSAAFGGCSSLKSIILPNSVNSIGMSAFYGCSSLESVIIPDSVMNIPNNLFFDCTSLKSVVLPKGVTKISSGMFWGCTSLTEYTILDGVTSIESLAFDASGITTVSIPDSVKEIGDLAFAYCKNLKKIVIPKSVASIGKDTFVGCAGLTIYGKSGSSAEVYAKNNNIKFIVIKN